jgi:hypothetical protein
MITVTLSDHERQQLETTFTTTTDRRLRNRCQAILMAARRRRHAHIAEDLNVTTRGSVANLLFREFWDL